VETDGATFIQTERGLVGQHISPEGVRRKRLAAWYMSDLEFVASAPFDTSRLRAYYTYSRLRSNFEADTRSGLRYSITVADTNADAEKIRCMSSRRDGPS
jgi:hypothetical protein